MAENSNLKEIIQDTLLEMGMNKKDSSNKDLVDFVSFKAKLSLARQQLAKAKPQITGQHFPNAKLELDEIIKASNKSTEDILDCAGILDELESELPEKTATQLRDVVTTIYNSSINHDIMIQRINKVSNILDTLNDDIINISNGKEITIKKTDPLLEGPQSLENGQSQDDVDKFFS